MSVRLLQTCPRSPLDRLLLALVACAASATPHPAAAAQPVCAIRRPQQGFVHPELDAAWSAYEESVAAAGEVVKRALARELEAAAGNRDAEGEVRRAIGRLERTGRLPLQKGCAAAVGQCREDCKKAWGELAAAYTRVAAALKEEKKIPQARDVERELAAMRAVTRPRPAFVAGRFGLEDGSTLGEHDVLKSWAGGNPAPAFKKLGLPPLKSDGVLMLELHDTHAKDLAKKDVLYSVNGQVLDGEDEWAEAQAVIHRGGKVDVVIKRPVRGVWRDMRTQLVPVSRAQVEMMQRVKRIYPERSQPPIGIDLTKPADRERLASMQLDATIKLPNQDALVELIFTDDDGLFSDLTLAVQAGSADDVVAMMEECGAERISAMDKLMRDTEWGMLRSKRDSTVTNGKVLLKAWEAVPEVFFPK